MAEMMIKSFQATAMESELLMLVDRDDVALDRYQKIFSQYDCQYIVQDRAPVTQLINRAFQDNHDRLYYHITNDDFIYHTKGWDRKFIDVLEEYGDGVAYGNDLLQEKHLPTAPFISGNIARSLGWLQMPSLTHLYGDNVWRDIGQGINSLFYLDQVIIEHVHFANQKSAVDIIYRQTNSSIMYKKDEAAYLKWKKEQLPVDIARIKEKIHEQENM